MPPIVQDMQVNRATGIDYEESASDKNLSAERVKYPHKRVLNRGTCHFVFAKYKQIGYSLSDMSLIESALIRVCMEFRIHSKEKFYFASMCVASLIIYAGLAVGAFFEPKVLLYGTYFLAFMLINLIGQLFLVGHIRGNAIKINQKQFPEIYEILVSQSERLGLKKVPAMYLLQNDGVLNAFATKFVGRNYVVIYSAILAAAYQEGRSAVEFIIGHELGHIKRNHVGFLKSFFLLPASFIPFLGAAYSRACEYTCDSIGYALCPEGAAKGLLILAAGTSLYKKINIDELLLTAQSEKGFVTWFAEIFSSHPHGTNRLAMFDNRDQAAVSVSPFVADADQENPVQKEQNF